MNKELKQWQQGMIDKGWTKFIIYTFTNLNIMADLIYGVKFTTIVFHSKEDMNLYRLTYPSDRWSTEKIRYRLYSDPPFEEEKWIAHPTHFRTYMKELSEDLGDRYEK